MYKTFYYLIISFIFLSGCTNERSNTSKNSFNEKVNDLISKMTIDEKIGQMTQITLDVFLLRDAKNKPIEPFQIDTAKLRHAVVDYKIGSILNCGGHANTRETWKQIMTQVQSYAQKTRLKIPILYGIDAIHGVNYTVGATLSPQQIALAASWNPEIARQCAEITAYECRASYIPWTFAPVMDIGRNPVWPRFWETFGEDVYLGKQMGVAMIQGFQGDNTADKKHVTACLKHFAGYSMPLSGKDRTPAWIPERYLREYYLPGFEACIKAGANNVMVCSGEINGIPTHANKQMLTDILHGELQLDGFAVSDWEDIKYLCDRHKIAETQEDAVEIAVNAGIDMSMVPSDFSFADHLKKLVKEGKVSEERIDEAVKRILKVKFQTGIFDKMFYDDSEYKKFGGSEFAEINRNAAREVITLLKNDKQTLPIKKGMKILVTGPTANSMRSLNGGWSYTWQGENTDVYAEKYNTVLEALQEKNGKANVNYVEGSKFDTITNLSQAVSAAKNVDAVVLCLGETSYTENMGNINDLNISRAQETLALELAKTGKPIILVLLEGRPRIISQFENKMMSVLMGYLPGNEGGNAIADIIFGETNPSGKLPFTYPRHSNSLVPYDHKYTEENGVGVPIDPEAEPQYPFGFGLSYTKFSYSNLKVSKGGFVNDSIQISVDVTNTGAITGKETVQLYISDLYASITPPVKRLRGFSKIELAPKGIKRVNFKIGQSELAFVGLDNKWVTEPGEFMVTIAQLSQKIVLK